LVSDIDMVSKETDRRPMTSVRRLPFRSTYLPMGAAETNSASGYADSAIPTPTLPTLRYIGKSSSTEPKPALVVSIAKYKINSCCLLFAGVLSTGAPDPSESGGFNPAAM
jgi:hypothetical protein